MADRQSERGDDAERRTGALTRPASRLLRRMRAGLEGATVEPEARAAGLRVYDRAERVLARLDRVAATLETAARIEVELLRRLRPIVDDLGELVRHTLDEARERRGLEHRAGDLPLGLRRPSAPRSSASPRGASGAPPSPDPAPEAAARSARRPIGSPRSGSQNGALTPRGDAPRIIDVTPDEDEPRHDAIRHRGDDLRRPTRPL